MPRPVEESSRPIAVALEPNGEAGSLPSAFCKSSAVGSLVGTGANWARSGRPRSVSVGGVAPTICCRKWPVEARMLAR